MFIVLLAAVPAIGASIDALSCSQSDVETALRLAGSGDTVIVPAGECTWQNEITEVPEGVILKGSGIGSTVIQAGTTVPIHIFASDNSVIDGFMFINALAHPILHYPFNENGGTRNWVIMNCYFDNTTGERLQMALGDSVRSVSGVYHNNTFINIRITAVGTGRGVAEWGEPDAFGATEGVVYIEGCVGPDAWSQGRTVGRPYSKRCEKGRMV